MRAKVLTPTWQARFERSLGAPFGGVTFRPGLPPGHRGPNGPVALATDPGTIHLAHTWWVLPPAARLAVLAHELAHTVQLSRSGDDPEDVLEGEAWKAAACALTGTCFEIRGAGNSPLGARAFVASNFTKAIAFYKRFKREPVTDTHVLRIDDALSYPATVEGLLAKLATSCSKGETILIVAHSAKEGVALPLVTGSGFGLNTDNANRVITALGKGNEAIDAASKTAQAQKKNPSKPLDVLQGVPAVQSLAQDASLGVGTLAAMMVNLRTIRSLDLAGIHFRGCNLGCWESITLPAFKELFGCRQISAVDLQSAFSVVPMPTVRSGRPAGPGRPRHDPFAVPAGKKNVVVDGVAPNRLSFSFRIDNTHHKLLISDARAESPDAARGFISRNLSTPEPGYTTGEIPIHVLISLGTLVFPYSKGSLNSVYHNHVKTLQ